MSGETVHILFAGELNPDTGVRECDLCQQDAPCDCGGHERCQCLCGRCCFEPMPRVLILKPGETIYVGPWEDNPDP